MMTWNFLAFSRLLFFLCSNFNFLTTPARSSLATDTMSCVLSCERNERESLTSHTQEDLSHTRPVLDTIPCLAALHCWTETCQVSRCWRLFNFSCARETFVILHALLQRISNVPFKIFSPVNFLLLHSHERKQQRALVNVCLAMKKLFSDSFDAHFFAAQLLSPLCCFPGVCAIESLMCQNKIEKFPLLCTFGYIFVPHCICLTATSNPQIDA